MSRTASTFGLALTAGRQTRPAWRWIYEVLRRQILAGQLKAGTRLPATRDLAEQYGFSRGTIVSAFEQLIAEGYVEGRTGSGTFVARTLPETLLQSASFEKSGRQRARTPKRPLAPYGKSVKLFTGYEIRPTRAFRPNLPALDLFPMELWARISARVLRRAPTRILMGYGPMGYLPLRETVAEYLSTSRGVHCSAQQIAIVSGVQEALDIVARLLIQPGDTVCMEDPGYTGAAALFAATQARLRPTPVDEKGLMVNHLPRDGVRVVYVTPGHQFPLGVTMSLERRGELIRWALDSGALIVEDDYDCEYRYSGRPVPALQGLAPPGVALYAGTFSKTLFPGLRLGYMVVPNSLVDRVEAMISVTTRHAPVLDQAVLHTFMREGHFARHVRQMRTIYAERLGTLLTQVESRLGGALAMTGIEAGLQAAGWLSKGFDATRIAARAAELGVEVVPLNHYAIGKHRFEGLQLGFAAVNPREIRLGIEALARVCDQRK